jgi:hypothetical protein
MGLTAWMSNLGKYCQTSIPRCGQPSCTFAQRLWRRVRWWNGTIRLHGLRYCAPQCFEDATRQCFARICDTSVRFRPVQHRIPLGLLMLSRGELSNQQLRSALDAQRANGCRRIGEWLEELGFATEQQVTNALGLQWACPVLTTRVDPDSRCVRLVPFRILETYRMLPLQFVEPTGMFYVAFSEGIDYAVLHAVERMLDCRTEACLVTRSTMDKALEQIGRDRHCGDLLFEGWRHASEMARITCSYVLKLGAEDARVISCGSCIWVRLYTGGEVANLIFRHPGRFRDQAASFEESFARQITG